ncbi:MAG: RtcB family protein [candidate division Zixibacteria bacterium]|nr:RtcB family protein [candidate division Zixibacteria bacterium]
MKYPVTKIRDGVWEIDPRCKPGMRVPARLYSSEKLLAQLDDGVFEQVTNVAMLPGIVGHALCMPDGHWGYGFPIGGVAAFSLDDGVISPGGIGFDINCGMRLIRTNLTLEEIQPKLPRLLDRLFQLVPAGVGVKGSVHLSKKEFANVLVEGVDWCVKNGYGYNADRESVEQRGQIPNADPDQVSEKASERGRSQLGTLGSGNHYLEIEVIKPENIFDEAIARRFGIDRPNQIVVLIHCGSRGCGHQVATDHLQVFAKAMQKYGIRTNDRELACAPFNSPEGQSYFKGMACAANNAFANRQIIVHHVRQAFVEVLGIPEHQLGLETIYDVAHNIAKIETYDIAGKKQKVIVHRKGATRAFGPDNPDVPEKYRDIGQPVLVGGSMQTGSYLLVGTSRAMDETYGSTLHGSGRTMSRMQAKKMVRGSELIQKMAEDGIMVRAASLSGLAEEVGFAYKQIDDVISAVDDIGISRKVAKLVPIGNIKG